MKKAESSVIWIIVVVVLISAVFLFKNFGADIVNMTTVPEVILARELGICYASIAMATDYDSWKEGEESVTWEIVLKTMEHNAANVKNFLFEIISKINYLDCSCR